MSSAVPNRRCRALSIVVLAALGAVGAVRAAPAAEETIPVRFVQERSAPGREPAQWLREWLVLREESGERAPGRTVVAPLSESVRVPVGRWSWVALGDDWIAESSAPLDLTAPAASPQTVHLRQLRGCPLEIQPNEAWQRIEQVGILSTHFTNEVVLPRELLTRLVVPAGSNAILFYGSGGRPVALQTQLFCKAGQRLEVPPALPPEGERRAVVARLAVPPNLDDLDAGARLEVEAREAGSLEDRRGAPPASLVRFRHEVVALYPELPASDLELQVAGNLVRSERALLPSERGTVRVVPVALRPRQTLRLEVDLRLRTAGRSATFRLWHCADRVVDDLLLARRWAAHGCSREAERRLEPGWQLLELPGLDSGSYVLTVASAGDTLFSWEYGLRPVLDPTAERFEPLGAWRIEEFVIDGELRFDDRSATGELVIEGRGEGPSEVERFPTDEMGSFRWSYLGRPLAPAFQPPNGLRSLLEAVPPERRIGMPRSWRISARVDGRGWFPFANESLFLGGGSLEIALEPGVPTRVAVRDRASGAPLPGASVALFGRRGLVFFLAGQLERVEESGSFDLFRTDEEGLLEVVLPHEPSLRIVVGKEGFAGGSRDLSTLDVSGPLDIELALDSAEKIPAGAVRLLVNEKPLPRAVLLKVASSGEEDRVVCAIRSDSEGWLLANPGCDPWDSESAFVLHPESRIRPLTLVGVRERGVLEVEPAGRRPLVLRLLDAEGAPVAGRRLALRASGLRLEGALFAMLRDVVSMPETVTDTQGELVLPACFDWRDLEWAAQPAAGGAPAAHAFRSLPRPVGRVVELYAD